MERKPDTYFEPVHYVSCVRDLKSRIQFEPLEKKFMTDNLYLDVNIQVEGEVSTTTHSTYSVRSDVWGMYVKNIVDKQVYNNRMNIIFLILYLVLQIIVAYNF